MLATLLTAIADYIVETLGEPEDLPFRVLTEARDFTRISEKVGKLLQTLAWAHKAVQAATSASQSTLDGLGVVREHNPLPVTVSAVPSLLRQKSMRFE